jgi:septum formation protein
MLSALSGKRHKVITGMALRIPQKGMKTWTVSTPVLFHRFTPADIEWYLDTVEWKDAAGAYKIQGAGACLVRKIIGSYPNVMGLPIDSLYGILRRYKFPFGEKNPRY